MPQSDKSVNLGHVAEHPDVIVATRYEQRSRGRIIEHVPFDRTYIAADALLSDSLVDEIIEIVCGWSGETGTDYMAVMVEVRKALTDAWTGEANNG